MYIECNDLLLELLLKLSRKKYKEYITTYKRRWKRFREVFEDDDKIVALLNTNNNIETIVFSLKNAIILIKILRIISVLLLLQ